MYNNFNYEHYGSFGFNPFWIVGLSLLGILAFIFVIALLALKGYSLWIAAKRNEKWWFVALLFINTLGLLELAYLIFVAKVLFNSKHHKVHSEDKKEHIPEDKNL